MKNKIMLQKSSFIFKCVFAFRIIDDGRLIVRYVVNSCSSKLCLSLKSKPSHPRDILFYFRFTPNKQSCLEIFSASENKTFKVTVLGVFAEIQKKTEDGDHQPI